jgi:pimeloyl-ACP methyl ester carboxylesterase
MVTACRNANAYLPPPKSFTVTPVSSGTSWGATTFRWTPVPNLSSSDGYIVSFQMNGTSQSIAIGQDQSIGIDIGQNTIPSLQLPYNSNSFTASKLPAYYPLRFAIQTVKKINAANGVGAPLPWECVGGPAYASDLVTLTSSAPAPYQLGVLPTQPQPVIPDGDDIILYVHGGPGSRLEEASDLVNPLIELGPGYGKRFTVISFDQVSQGYSSMIGPSALVPAHQPGMDYYPLVAFSENSIVAFVNALKLENRNIHIIGGSTGGALTLRMGHRADLPWVKKIVAWNAASVWNTYHRSGPTDADGWVKGIPLDQAFGRATSPEIEGGSNDSRKSYFDGVFGPPVTGLLDQWVAKIQPNPEEWYRGDRDRYPSSGNTQKPFRAEWPCKWDYIGEARLEQQEIYNSIGRQWHYRLGTEELLFSFFNSNSEFGWVGPAHTASGDSSDPAYYSGIVKPTMLVASDDDDWNEGYVPPEAVAALSAWLGTLMTPGPGTVFGGVAGFFAGAIAGPIYLQWEDRWTRTHVMAPLMTNTPGYTLYVPDTGHSIHNERPIFFSEQILKFFSNPGPTAGPLQPWPGQIQSPQGVFEFDESRMPAETNCQPLPVLPSSQFPLPDQTLLDAAPNDARDAVGYLGAPAQFGGNFMNNASPGTYGLRLRKDLRAAAEAVPDAKLHPGNPTTALTITLANAAAAFYRGDYVTADALADLAVTGRSAYSTLQIHQPTADEITVAAGLLSMPNPKGVEFQKAVLHALTRAYEVAWALRNPDTQTAFQYRPGLGYIAVSAEDDPPARPVNVPSGLPIFGPDGKTQIASYPQYEVQISMCPAMGLANAPQECPARNPNAVPILIRYSIASSESAAAATTASSRVPSVTFSPNTLRAPLGVAKPTIMAGSGAAPIVSTSSSSSHASAAQATSASSSPAASAQAAPTASAPGAGAQAASTVRAPAGAMVAQPKLTPVAPSQPPMPTQAQQPTHAPVQAPTQPAIPAQAQLPPLSVSVCISVDGRSCLRPGQTRPLINGSRIMDLVTVNSGGAPVAAATVIVSGQNIAVQTNPNGVAVVIHQPCVTRTIPSSAVACEASVSKSGYRPFTLALP